MRRLAGLVMVLGFYASVGQGLTDDMKATEEQLYASTKQINQFFRRFNGEEDDRGDRYYEGDKKYRDSGLRRKYLPMLFDEEAGSSEDVRKDFVKQLTDRKTPVFLDFHRDDWVAEVNAQFRFKGQDVTALLYMKLQAQGQGYEWVIDDVSFEPFKTFFEKDTSDQKQFIHPMSHELEFMTLRKAFANNEYPEQYTPRSYEPDYLTLFLYEMKRGNLKFKTVKNVRFHFFDIGGWYFELANFNRPGYNTGWLISNLMKIQNDQQLALLKAYVYDKN
ncbi:hypothetical protein [Marinoscillum furvescens]|uniref:Uncharacterized protein n=1 Tax=Marinoscillum furvescens DSM 4134 TaxID=1122208 RepID=A0A3D9KW29_MARFU|nr:hypothetical protein [Marinoscillum furvescens]RED92063.1 hypothetical protein C7460_13332 [Marinoscillum furvescens DSM 4134]